MLGQTHVTARSNSLTLRKQSTDAERLLWRRLRGEQLGVKFRRQHPFLSYVVDFVCIERRLVIELDGSQHMDSKRDALRDEALMRAGFRVLRFWNNQVLSETDAVVEMIDQALKTPRR